MHLSKFLKTWRGINTENRWARFIIAGLTLAVVVEGYALATVDRTVILVPPDLTHPVEIARSAATMDMKKSWAMFVAELLGNVTPGNASFITKAIDPLLDSHLRESVLKAISEQANSIKQEQVSLSFEPADITYEKTTDKIFVTGLHVAKGPGADPKRETRTYEFRFAVRSYHPYITHIQVYSGAPRLQGKAGAQPAEKSTAMND